MTHLLVIVLLIAFAPIALANIVSLLVPVVRFVFAVICAPFVTVGLILYILYRTPGALYRGGRAFLLTGGASEFTRGVAILAVVTLLMMPLFLI